MAKGPTLFNLTVGTQSALEFVYAALITDLDLMGLSTLSALSLEMAIDGVRVMQRNPSVKRVTTACVKRVVVTSDCKIPARSEVELSVRVIGKGPAGLIMIGPMTNECEYLCGAVTVSEIRVEFCIVRVLYPTKNLAKL